MKTELSGPECPRCGSNDLAVEKRMNGDAKCLASDCGWEGPYADCYRKAFNEIKDEERKLFEYHGMGPAEVQAASFAFKAFLERDEKRDGAKSFWHSPLGRKAFILGYGSRK